MTSTWASSTAWRPTLLAVFMATVCVVMSCFANEASAQRIIWQDDDPGLEADGSGGDFDVPVGGNINFGGGGLTVNVVDGVAATGDASRALVGQVVMNGSGKFTNFNSSDLEILPEDHGTVFEYSMDYFVPADTTFDTLPDESSPDLFYLQINFDGVNSGSGGFFGLGAADTGWNTVTVSGNVPNGATTALAFGLIVDGGFGAGSPNGDGTGTALYVDNILLATGLDPTGDFSNDDDVDGQDFILWQQRFENPPPFNPILETSAEDLVVWQQNYGTTLGESSAGVSAVPEPSTCVLGLITLVAGLSATRRRA